MALRQEATELETSLIKFVEAAWHQFDASEFQPHWALTALCEHLEAVTSGDIRRLLINYPPRCAKTNIVSICWPAWTWARRKKEFLSGPQVRFMCGSYNADLSLKNSTLARGLLWSQWYQDRWGSRFVLRADQNTKSNFMTDANGARMSNSVGGSLIGMGYDCAIIDDPHNTGRDYVESDADRERVRNWCREIFSTRMNDPQRSAIVGVMQRMHMDDMSGYILAGENRREWTHFMLPMRYDKARHCVTVLKRDEKNKPIKAWQDKRKIPGELMWPERFDEKKVSDDERELGPYLASSRLQQNPEPPGGGLIKRDWWQLWDGNYPPFSHILGCVDTAFTEKTQNDPSALTIWGVFAEPKSKLPKVMLIYAWEGRKELHGLVEILAAMCSKSTKKANGYADVPSFPVDRLIIEGKASGKSVSQEMRRLYGNINSFSVEEVNPDQWGDKISRVTAVQHMFADGMIYASGRKLESGKLEPRNFAKPVIDQMAVFPYAAHDDLTDTASMALLYLRQVGFLERRDEFAMRQREEMIYSKPLEPLY